MNFQAVVFRITYAVFSNTCSLENTHFRDYFLKITYGKHLGLELNYLQEEIREVGREWKIMVPGSLQIRVRNLRNGPYKNDSDHGKEDVGMQKRCQLFYCLYLLLIGLNSKS